MNDISPEELPDCTQALLDVLVADEDLQLYTQVEADLRASDQRRKQELEELHSHVKVLSQTLTQLRSTSTRDAAGWKAGSMHADDMERLQAQNFDLVKRINDQEAELRTLEADVSTLQRDIALVDELDIEGQQEMDQNAIAVGLFRRMGFMPCYLKASGGKESSGETKDVFQSVMVLSETKNRSTEIDVDDDMMRAKGVTPYILANQLWRASD